MIDRLLIPHIHNTTSHFTCNEDYIILMYCKIRNCALQSTEYAPSQDVKPTIVIWKERTLSTKALIPCGSWTQEIEQLHRKLLIKHAKLTPKETEIGA